MTKEGPVLQVSEMFTPRQLKILTLVMSGTTTRKSLSKSLHISPRTVKRHFENIFGIIEDLSGYRPRNKMEVICFLSDSGLLDLTNPNNPFQ